MLSAEYILPGLVALGALATLVSAIGRSRSFKIEERLTRYLSRPFVDEDRSPSALTTTGCPKDSRPNSGSAFSSLSGNES